MRILMVDDNVLSTEALGLILKNAGYEVVQATTGDEALAKIRIALPDVVLTDLLMPGMDGVGLVQRIWTSHPGLPVLLITAIDGPELEQARQALAGGPLKIIPKPIHPDDLLREIESVANALKTPGESK